MHILIGIDFGTTKTLVAWWVGDHPEAIRLGTGRDDIPTALYLAQEGSFLIGEDAVEHNDGDLQRSGFVDDFKRGLLTNKVYQLRGRSFTATELTAKFLKGVLGRCETEATHQPIKEAVITVPVSFGPAARENLRAAAIQAGLSSVELINEPEAAARAYLHEQKRRGATAKRLMIFDWGGGTLDLALAELDGDSIHIHPHLFSGDPQLGGRDIDDCLMDWVDSEAISRNRSSIFDEKNIPFFSRNQREVTKAKERLSKTSSATLGIQTHEGVISLTIDREKLNQLIGPLCQRAQGLVNRLVDLCGQHALKPDGLILIGGTSRIPLVAESIASAFNLQPIVYHHGLSAVALGSVVGAFDGHSVPAAFLNLATSVSRREPILNPTQVSALHEFNKNGFRMNCGWLEDFLIRTQRGCLTSASKMPTTSRVTALVFPPPEPVVKSKTQFARHDYNKNGFCVNCGWLREYVERTHRACLV